MCPYIREVSSFQRVLCTASMDLKMCPYYLISEGVVYRLQWSWGPEDVSLLERCPHFRGCCVQELGT